MKCSVRLLVHFSGAFYFEGKIHQFSNSIQGILELHTMYHCSLKFEDIQLPPVMLHQSPICLLVYASPYNGSLSIMHHLVMCDMVI
jgi:hypothetical protein